MAVLTVKNKAKQTQIKPIGSQFKPFFNHGWTQMNTDGEKTLTRIARIFAKGSGAGWGYLPYGRRTQLAGNHGGKAEG